jgi:hypothetical protein
MVHYGQMLFHFSLSMWMENKTSNIGRCKAELKLNHTLAVSGEQSRPMLSSNKDVALAHLVFGSWPRSEFQKSFEEDDIFSEKISTSPGVVACLSEVSHSRYFKNEINLCLKIYRSTAKPRCCWQMLQRAPMMFLSVFSWPAYQILACLEALVTSLRPIAGAADAQAG